jgi:hypothetical protein
MKKIKQKIKELIQFIKGVAILGKIIGAALFYECITKPFKKLFKIKK